MTRMVVITLMALLAAPALAEKPNWAGSKAGKGQAAAGAEQGGLSVGFSLQQRGAVGSYYGERYGKGCPPGLAKKNNGCLPPGIAKKRYAVGARLGDGITLQPLPPELELRLGIPPVGFRYGLIDGDVVKLAIGTWLVVDAIDGLSR